MLGDKRCGGQGDELCSGSTMTQKASAPWYDLATDQGVSRNEGNRAGLLKKNEAAGGVESVSGPLRLNSQQGRFNCC